MSGPLRRRLELPKPNRSGLVVRSDPALPSPVTDLANNLSAASISQSPGRRSVSGTAPGLGIARCNVSTVMEGSSGQCNVMQGDGVQRNAV